MQYKRRRLPSEGRLTCTSMASGLAWMPAEKLGFPADLFAMIARQF